MCRERLVKGTLALYTANSRATVWVVHDSGSKKIEGKIFRKARYTLNCLFIRRGI